MVVSGTVVLFVVIVARGRRSPRWQTGVAKPSATPLPNPHTSCCGRHPARRTLAPTAAQQTWSLPSWRLGHEEEGRAGGAGGHLTGAKRLAPARRTSQLPHPHTPVRQFLRCDGDLYVSIFQCLVTMLPRLSVGGLVYVDDYWEFHAARQATDEVRELLGIQRDDEPIWTILRDRDSSPDYPRAYRRADQSFIDWHKEKHEICGRCKCDRSNCDATRPNSCFLAEAQALLC